MTLASVVELDEVLCSCGTELPLPFVAHLVQHPFAQHPCMNPNCRMLHRFLPPQTIRSELSGPNADDSRLCHDAPSRPAEVPGNRSSA